MKDLSTNQIVQLISAFLAEVTLTPNVLLANYDLNVFEGEEVPYHFDRLDETLRVLNANLTFYQLLAQLCQHVQYDFEMVLQPGRYEKEWRQIISLLVHFTLFKKEYETRHLELAEESKSGAEQLRDLTLKLTALIDLKCQNEKRKQEALSMQSELGFRLDEARAQAEIAGLEKD